MHECGDNGDQAQVVDSITNTTTPREGCGQVVKVRILQYGSI